MNSSPQSMPYARATSIASEKRGEADWLATTSIVAYGVRIGIRTNRSELLSEILDYAPPLWRPTSGASVERMFSFRFGSSSSLRGSSHSLLDSLEAELKSRSLKRLLEAFQVRLKMYVAEMARRRVFVHAGVVGWKGKAILIPGRSMSGKTSLVAELVRAGATYYSDEYAVLDIFGHVHPYPEPLAIRKEGRAGQKKMRAEDIGGVTGVKPLEVGQVVVARYKTGACWRPTKLSAGQALLELLGNTIPARRKPEVVIPILREVVSGASALKGVRGEARKAVKLILHA